MARRRAPASTAAFSALARAYQRGLGALGSAALRGSRQASAQAQRVVAAQLKPPRGPGDWLSGMALGPAGMRRFFLYRPPGLAWGERLPLLVMLHGCGQNARDFADSTRMNGLAARERFLVLYPEQDRLHHPQGCWNWYDQRAGKADAEAATLMAAIDQACLLYPADRHRVALAGLSAGASMAALLAMRYPLRFRAVAMHSGVPPGAARSPASALGAMRGRRAPAELPLPAIGGHPLPPLLVLHGDADRVVSHANAEAAASLWARATGARAGAPRDIQRGKRLPMRVTEYSNAAGVRVRQCDILGLGHAWSGGSSRLPFGTPAGPDAARMIWSFAARCFEAPAPASMPKSPRRPGRSG